MICSLQEWASSVMVSTSAIAPGPTRSRGPRAAAVKCMTSRSRNLSNCGFPYTQTAQMSRTYREPDDPCFRTDQAHFCRFHPDPALPASREGLREGRRMLVSAALPATTSWLGRKPLRLHAARRWRLRSRSRVRESSLRTIRRGFRASRRPIAGADHRHRTAARGQA